MTNIVKHNDKNQSAKNAGMLKLSKGINSTHEVIESTRSERARVIFNIDQLDQYIEELDSRKLKATRYKLQLSNRATKLENAINKLYSVVSDVTIGGIQLLGKQEVKTLNIG